MFALFKPLPLIAAMAGGTAMSPEIKAKIAKITNYTKVIATQTEVNSIAKIIYMDTFDNIQRDTSKDQFGIPYRYKLVMRKRTFKVTSAGPDMKFGTSDDIYAGYDY